MNPGVITASHFLRINSIHMLVVMSLFGLVNLLRAIAQDPNVLFTAMNSEMDAGRYDRGETIGNQLLTVSTRLNSQSWIAASLNAIGRTYNAQGRYGDADRTLLRANQIVLSIDNVNRFWIPCNLALNYACSSRRTGQSNDSGWLSISWASRSTGI